MRFKYSTTDPSQDEFDSLPRLPLVLRHNSQSVEAGGLVDSGATVNVLPYQVGAQLGATWDDGKATIRLAGSLGNLNAMPLVVTAQVGEFAPVRLAFAWVKSNNVTVSTFYDFTISWKASIKPWHRRHPKPLQPEGFGHIGGR